MAAESRFVPMDVQAKGKSSLFKFVSLRSPSSTTVRQHLLVINQDSSRSTFLSALSDINSTTNYNDLLSIAKSFEHYISPEDIRRVNPELFEFSILLASKRGNFTKDDLPETLPSRLTAGDLVTLWDNLFYFLITRKSPDTRTAIMEMLIGDNFVANNQSALEITEDYLNELSLAKIIVPRAILSRPERKSTLSKYKEQQLHQKYGSFDEEESAAKVNSYERAVEEMIHLNDRYLEALSKVDPSDLDDSDAPELDSEASPKAVTIENFLRIVGNPIEMGLSDPTISEETKQVIKDLDLANIVEPEKAIATLMSKIKTLNNEIFQNKVLSKKHVIVGSSIIEVNNSRNNSGRFTEGCFPEITDTQNVFVDTNLKALTGEGIGFGTSGGASVNSFSGVGSVSFELIKYPPVGTSYYIGLSPANLDDGYTSIKYAIQILYYYDGPNPKCRAIPVKDGVNLNFGITCAPDDNFKISRTTNSAGETVIIWHRLRPETGLLSEIKSIVLSGTDTTEPLLLDFAFSARLQSVHNVLLNPCNNGGGSQEPDNDVCSGITNLGIGDYMRVEQEVCCYSPGEVSHIENIMQGEYKERSSRMLRREETTNILETESTTEKLRDTTTTDRNEMEQESSQVQQNDSAFEIGVNLSAKYGPMKLTVDSGFASSSSTVNANSQSVSYAKEVSSRALDRVVKRVREERIHKVIEEFEENNKHGLDNRNNPDGHVTGIYRWVDKIYKNQVVNYGKRMTFEFMIPEPAKFHLWAMTQEEPGFDQPLDPREHGLSKHSLLTENNYAQWAAQYSVDIAPPPSLTKKVSKAYSFPKSELNTEVFANSYNDFQIPEGYTATSATVFKYWQYVVNNKYSIEITVGSQSYQHKTSLGTAYNQGTFNLGNIEGILPIAIAGDEVYMAKLNIVATCMRKPETFAQWQIEGFNKILDAYLEKLAAFESAVTQAKTQSSFGIKILGNNPLNNRIIEEQELKKGCLNWLEVTYGNDYYNEISPCDGVSTMPNMVTDGDLACHSQTVKFFEQAFEWDIMSYLFYPYMYGKKCSWKEIYRLDDNDPVFRGFLQAGMARVVVPIRPGYEAAVMYYLETKEVWNGSEPPVPGDPLYMALAADLARQAPHPVGAPWETRVPTSLNILQQNSSAVVADGLPCGCDHYETDGTGTSVLTGQEVADDLNIRSL